MHELLQFCFHIEPKVFNLATVEPVYYGHLGTSKKCPDYQDVPIFQVILKEKGPFGTSNKCVDDAGVIIFKFSH